ncbi:unnamed protein product, partial [Iphiclides podalirius]
MTNSQRSGDPNRDNFLNPREVLTNNQQSFDNSGIELSRDTVVVVHGHQASAFSSLNPALKNTFLQNYDVNVIVVDWATNARLSYSLAVSAVPSVGAYIGDLISTLVDANKVSLDRLHLIGFGLGAHVVGFAGRKLQGTIARITGLDPSGQQWGSNSGRLANSDARYVEVIHTDSDGLLSNGLGIAIGDVDFFPNGGSNQPGCLLSSTCSHNRAWELFAATLRVDNELVGNGCASARQLKWDRCNGDPLKMGTNEYSKRG